jgi:hypothetical protein
VNMQEGWLTIVSPSRTAPPSARPHGRGPDRQRRRRVDAGQGRRRLHRADGPAGHARANRRRAGPQVRSRGRARPA